MKPRRIVGAAVALVAAAALAWALDPANEFPHAGWWHGIAERGWWFYWLCLPLGLVVAIGQTVSPDMPAAGRRLAHVPVLLWVVVIALIGAGPVIDSTPLGVLLLGLFVCPLLAGLHLAFWLLWLCCAAALLRLLVGLLMPVERATDALFVAAAAAWLFTGWIWLTFASPTRRAKQWPAGEEAVAERRDAPGDDWR